MTVATFFAVADAQASIATAGASTAGAITAATTTTVTAGYTSSKSGAFYLPSFFRFDLSSLDANTTLVQTAEFDYWINAIGANPNYAYKTTLSWVETNSTASPSYDLATQTAALAKVNTTAYQVSSDAQIIAWITDWIVNPSGNFGLTVVADNSVNASWTIRSREFTGTTSDPFVSVTYTTTAKGVQPTSGPGAAAQGKSRR